MAPTNIVVISLSSYSIQFTWEDPSPANGIIRFHTIRINTSDTSHTEDSFSIYFSYFSLTACSSYTFEVSATTDCCPGPYSSALNVTTPANSMLVYCTSCRQFVKNLFKIWRLLVYKYLYKNKFNWYYWLCLEDSEFLCLKIILSI